MDEKISKSSFLINKELFSFFIDHIHSFNQQENDKTRFQIVNSSIKGSQIIIYRSGIIVYEEQYNLISLIEEFFNQYNHESPKELIKSKELMQEVIIEHSIPQEKYTQSFWLANFQIVKLVKYLENLNFKFLNDVSTKILYRICDSNDNCLTINSNNIITTNAISVFHSHINKIISDNPVDKEFDLYIGIESIGLFSQIGPVIVTLAGLDTNQSILLQSLGVKHAELGRKLEIEKYQSAIIDELLIRKTIQIPPQEFNLEKADNFISKVISKVLTEIKGNIQSSLRTVFYLDEKLKSVYSEISKIFPEALIKIDDQSMSSAAASVINRVEFDNWINDMSSKYSIKMVKSNLSLINNLSDREKLIKVKYVKNKKRSENNKPRLANSK